ncbi:histone H3-K4 methyltransferase [Capsaspora owczarzaki ATCC 30864]|uniref:Histone H3-K4 methyltransferase n=2 Tax=Capsaspora owczarzaki (strain ATCC 30864) TaxID=595528 RepID=A0A0D2WQ11_CAPO3|nr:histone H3-K4 methyltransferase [Capsaspora owczarzaki ATCC 30864]
MERNNKRRRREAEASDAEHDERTTVNEFNNDDGDVNIEDENERDRVKRVRLMAASVAPDSWKAAAMLPDSSDDDEDDENDHDDKDDENENDESDAEEQDQDQDDDEDQSESESAADQEDHTELKADGTHVVHYKNGNTFTGTIRDGLKQGPGVMQYHDGVVLTGTYVDDQLEGASRYDYPDKTYVLCTHHRSRLTGLATEYDDQGRRLQLRHHNNSNDNSDDNDDDDDNDDVEILATTMYYVDGGRLDLGPNVTNNDEEAQSPDTSATAATEGVCGGEYDFPNSVVTLRGDWRRTTLISARAYDNNNRPFNPVAARREITCAAPSTCFEPAPESDTLSAKFTRTFATDAHICDAPLLPDPHESILVYVAPSTVPGAGEGLFARVDIAPRTVVSFYHGVRVSHAEVDARDWSANSNTISLDDTVVIDVPVPFDNVNSYCATLGHKANHHFQLKNAEYGLFTHPRFGLIKCVQALDRAIPAGSEIFVSYDYKPDQTTGDEPQAPQWYLDQYHEHMKIQAGR